MAEKFTVEMKGQGLKDLKQIAGLCKEDPERLLVRAFREWVELREDLEDLPVIRERMADYDRTGESVPLEVVMADYGVKHKRKKTAAKTQRTARASRKVRAARSA